MTTISRRLVAFAVAGTLATCSASKASTADADVQIINADAQIVLATGLIPQRAEGIGCLMLARIKDLDSSFQAAAGAPIKIVAISRLDGAVRHIIDDTNDTTVLIAGALAMAALEDLSATSGHSAVVQAEAEVDAVLIDYLNSKKPVSINCLKSDQRLSTSPDAPNSRVETALADARRRLICWGGDPL